MKDIYAIRLENTRRLLETEHSGVQSRMAAKLGMSRQLLSFYVGTVAGTNLPRKGMGPDVARRIEQAYKLPQGWLDNDHTDMAAGRQDSATVDVGAIGFDQGAPEPDTDEPFSLARISKAWLRTNANLSSMDKLSMVTMHGDSMSPTFDDGAILLIDRGWGTIKSDAVYALAKDGSMYVKRILRRVDGSLNVLSDNPNYPPELIENPSKSGIKVLGRVVAAWNTKKL